MRATFFVPRCRRLKPEDIAWTIDALDGAHATGDAGGAGGAGGMAGVPGRVRVRWLGTAGFALECEGYVVLIDPYVTRASLARCVLSRLQPDEEAIARHVPRADAIVVGHTHFDHALDVPAIARRTGARVFGSRSASALCLAAGVPAERVDVVEREPGSQPAVRQAGPFELRFLPSAHSRLVLGRVPFPGEIADCDHVPQRANDYRCGAVFGVEIRVAGKTLYHMGSAELVDSTLDVPHVDVLLMCVAGWTTSRNLPERVAAKIAPGAILLSHWDDFLRPIDAPGGARPLPGMQLPRLVERLARATRGIRVGTLPILGEVRV
jgi:L-ascorbate metabolism protein UlaG (beta-lactamase superfamily)